MGLRAYGGTVGRKRICALDDADKHPGRRAGIGRGSSLTRSPQRIGSDRPLAIAAGVFSRHLAPIAEGIAYRLNDAMEDPVKLPTPLSESNRSAGRDRVRRRDRRSPTAPSIRQIQQCVECASPTVLGRRYCNACRPEFDAFQRSGTETLEAQRREGIDPAHSSRQE